ncbi:MAG: hypothetical protein ABSA26_11670 [Thermoguttaceae bacterium]
MLYQPTKIVDRKICLTKNCPKRAPVEFFVIWDDGLSKRIVSAKYDVASVLPFDVKAEFLQSAHGFASGYSW